MDVLDQAGYLGLQQELPADTAVDIFFWRTCGLSCNDLAIVDIVQSNWKRAFLEASCTWERTRSG